MRRGSRPGASAWFSTWTRKKVSSRGTGPSSARPLRALAARDVGKNLLVQWDDGDAPIQSRADIGQEQVHELDEKRAEEFFEEPVMVHRGYCTRTGFNSAPIWYLWNMDTDPLRIGLIGYRGFGAFCAEAFHQAGQGRVVAFAGRDAQAMAKVARQCVVPTDLHRLAYPHRRSRCRTRQHRHPPQPTRRDGGRHPRGRQARPHREAAGRLRRRGRGPSWTRPRRASRPPITENYVLSVTTPCTNPSPASPDGAGWGLTPRRPSRTTPPTRAWATATGSGTGRSRAASSSNTASTSSTSSVPS